MSSSDYKDHTDYNDYTSSLLSSLILISIIHIINIELPQKESPRRPGSPQICSPEWRSAVPIWAPSLKAVGE